MASDHEWCLEDDREFQEAQARDFGEDEGDGPFSEDDDFDDGQPTMYEEYQDLYGGDDWDHGQYDSFE